MKHKALLWIIWSLAALFFLYEFVIRIAPSVMVDDLMKAFAISAAGVGSISAFYFYSYSPMQIPVGLLLDRFGIRTILTIATLVCGGGCWIFAFAGSVFSASLGRFFMGLGSAFAFVSFVYISTHFFHKNKRSFLIGIGNSIGMIGAYIAGGPTSLLEKEFGWRGTYIGFAVLGTSLAILIYLIMKSVKTHPKEKTSQQSILLSLRNVTRNSNAWINAIACFFIYATTVAFAGLWGISFIKNTYQLDEPVASFAISMFFIGWIVGGPFMGKFSDKMKKRKPFILISSLAAAATLCLIIYMPTMSILMLYILLFFVGLFSSAEILHFTIAVEVGNKDAKATSIAFTNFVTMLGGAFLQYIVGFLLDLTWDGTMNGTLRVYSPQNWQEIMSIFPLCFILCFLLTLMIKEKKYDHNPEVSY